METDFVADELTKKTALIRNTITITGRENPGKKARRRSISKRDGDNDNSCKSGTGGGQRYGEHIAGIT